ncbi:MAG TPA: hypothetical protein VGD31_04345 [Sphingobacteriaceae bacterium]
MSGRRFIMEIEGFNGSLPFMTDILSYSFPGLGAGQNPVADKEKGKVDLTSVFVMRASDKYSFHFLQYSANGKFLPKISLSETASVWSATIKRTFLIFTGCGVDRVIPWEMNGEKTEDIAFHFQDYQLYI